MDTRVQVMRGPKLDRAQREMWYTLRGGRKVRISAHARLSHAAGRYGCGSFQA